VTAPALLHLVRAAGIELFPESGDLRYRAPPGALTAGLKAELAAHKPAILAELRARANTVVQAISDAYDRLDALGPWTPPEATAHRDLGAEVDAAGRAYLHGEGDLVGLNAAILRWESALSAGRAAPPTSCRCGSVVVREESDRARFCGRCSRELSPARGMAVQ
jgi:TubC N-terminal docking domain